MRIIVRLVLAALVAGLLSVGLTAGSAQAANSSPGCVTRTEFSKFKRNMSMERVRKIAGQRGRVSSSSSFSDGDAWKTLEFRQCGRSWSLSSISVSFEKTEKQVYVPDVYCYDWDGDGYEEDCEDYGSWETRYRAPMVVTSKYAYWF